MTALAFYCVATDARAGVEDTGNVVQIGTYGGSCTNCAASGQIGDVRSSSDPTEYIGCSLGYYSANKTKLTCTAKPATGNALGCTLITGDSHAGHTVTSAMFTVAKSIKSNSYIVFSSSSKGTGGYCENLWIDNGSQFSVMSPTTSYVPPALTYNAPQNYNGALSTGGCSVLSDGNGGYYLNYSDMYGCRNVDTNSSAFFSCSMSADGFTGNYMTGGFDSAGPTVTCSAYDGTNSTTCTTTTPYLVDMFSMVNSTTAAFTFDGNGGVCQPGWAQFYQGSFATAVMQN